MPSLITRIYFETAQIYEESFEAGIEDDKDDKNVEHIDMLTSLRKQGIWEQL